MTNISTRPKAAIYGRVSVNRDTEPSASVTDQLATMTAAAERAGYQVTHVLSDDGVGASKYSRGTRHGFVALLELIDSGQVQAVAVWEASRLSRDMGIWVALRDLCEDRGVILLTASGTVDMSADGDRLGSGVLALVSEQAARETSRRVKRSRDRAAAAGLPHGRASYGYRRTYTEAGRLAGVEVIPEEAEVLIGCVRHVLAGASLNGYLRRLNDAGVPSPNMATAARMGRPVVPSLWTTTQTRKMLVRPAYVGLRVHRGEVVGQASWPALWDEDVRSQLLALFDARALGTRQRELRHWLSGVLTCHACQQSLRVNINKGLASYACATPCRRISIAQEPVEASVAELIVRTVADGRLRRQESTGVADLRAQLAAAQGRLEEAADAFARGDIGPTALGAVEARLEPLRDRLQAELDRATAPAVVIDPGEVLMAWDSLPADRKRSIARLVLGRIVVGPAGGRGLDPLTRLRFPDLAEGLAVAG